MQRLSDVDGSFLISETSTAHMHVVGTMILDAAGMPGGHGFNVLKELSVLFNRYYLNLLGFPALPS
jgi:hypothetical protein